MVKLVICDGQGTLGLPDPSQDIYDLVSSFSELEIQVAVASNSSRRTVEGRFRSADLPVPDVIATPAEIGRKKPAPEFVYRIQELAKVQPKEVVYLGDDDRTDTFCAINAHVLPFTAHYSDSGKPMNYGIPISEPSNLTTYLSSFGKQDEPYFGWNFEANCSDTNSSIEVHVLFGDHDSLGLTDNLKTIFKSQEEVTIGKNKLSNIIFHYLLNHCYLSGLTHDVDWITVYPGHAKDSENQFLDRFSHLLTRIFRQRFIPDLLVRHTTAPKSQYRGSSRRIFDQFRTVLTNDSYRSKIGGKTVLVLDDFTTSGYSLETARRMLLKAGAEKVICVAIAKYRAKHSVTHISEDWDPYQPCSLEDEDIEVKNFYGDLNRTSDAYFRDGILSVYE